MTWGRGSTRAWRTIRAAILRRDPYCQLRYDCCTLTSTQADHIVNVQVGGTDEPANLQGVCKACHDRKTRLEAARGRQQHRTRDTVAADQHPGVIPPHA